MASEWIITLTMPREAKRWHVTVLVSNSEDELLTTDEGNLISLTGRTKMAGRLGEKLKLDKSQIESFALELEKAWLAFYQDYQNGAAVGPAQATAAELLEEMPEDVRLEANSLLQDPDLIDTVQVHLRVLGVAGEGNLACTI